MSWLMTHLSGAITFSAAVALTALGCAPSIIAPPAGNGEVRMAVFVPGGEIAVDGDDVGVVVQLDDDGVFDAGVFTDFPVYHNGIAPWSVDPVGAVDWVLPVALANVTAGTYWIRVRVYSGTNAVLGAGVATGTLEAEGSAPSSFVVTVDSTVSVTVPLDWNILTGAATGDVVVVGIEAINIWVGGGISIGAAATATAGTTVAAGDVGRLAHDDGSALYGDIAGFTASVDLVDDNTAPLATYGSCAVTAATGLYWCKFTLDPTVLTFDLDITQSATAAGDTLSFTSYESNIGDNVAVVAGAVYAFDITSDN